MNQYLYTAIIILITVAVFLILFWRTYKNPVVLSVRESLDKLPDGIMFASLDGSPILTNNAMESIWRKMTGQTFVPNAKMMWTAIVLNSMPYARGSQEEVSLCFTVAGDNSYQFSRDYLTADDGTKYMQILAVNVSDIINTKNLIEINTEELKSQQKRLSKMLNEIVEIAKKEEILNQKILVHEKLGKSLLLSKQALVKNSPKDKKAALSLWDDISTGLSIGLKEADRAQGYSAGKRLLEELFTTSSMLNVEFVFEGELPEDDEISYTIGLLANEAIINAVRHANATVVTMTMEELPDRIVVTLDNNGTPRGDNVSLGGGLSSIRERIENLGGSLNIEISGSVRYIAEFKRF